MSIKVGDLVMVAKPMPCCGSTEFIGIPFTVVELYATDMSKCAYCGHVYKAVVAYGYSNLPVNARRLIKIDPPSLPESLEREKELSV